jgi:hypothetical protein
VPVSVAKRMANDSILKVIVTKGVEITAVAHSGRNIRAHQRTALLARDPKCIVPAARSAEASRSTTGHRTSKPVTRASKSSLASAPGITTRRATAATPTEGAPAPGNGSPPKGRPTRLPRAEAHNAGNRG